MSDKRVLIVAQTPPPFHGQSIMQKYLAEVSWNWCKKEFVRMNFSSRVREIGIFRFKKVFELFGLIKQIKKRARSKFEVVYYPPGGPKRIPVYRDIILLFFLKTVSKKIILHFHAGGINHIFDKVTKLESYFIKKAFQKADAVIVLSDWLKKEIEWSQPKKVFVVSNGIEDVFERFPKKTIENSSTTFLFIGNLKEEKGVFTLLQSAARIRDLGERFVLKFMGSFHSSKEERYFFNFINENKLNDCVQYLGSKTNDAKWSEFEKTDVLCLPTYETEAMPISILEAMMFQIPVITTRWRSIPDFIRHEENGLLFEPENAGQLAECMQRMIRSKEERIQMGVKGRKDFLENFTVEKHLKNMERVFREILV